MVGYGLFCIAEVPIEKLNKILYDAARPDNRFNKGVDSNGRPPPFSTERFEFLFWLATEDWPGPDSWNHTTYKVDDEGGPDFTSGTAGENGGYMAPTIPPISKNYKSPYIGKTIPEVLQIVERGESTLGLRTEMFAIADQQTVEDGSLLLCHRDGNEEMEFGISTMRVHPYVAIGVFTWLIKACIDDDDGPKSTEGIWWHALRRDARLIE